MSRPLSTLVSFLCVTAAAVGFAFTSQHESSFEVGRQLLAHRLVIDRIEHYERNPVRPLLVWMGDSTMLTRAGVESYPSRISRRLRPAIQRVHLTQPGVDFYHHYFLMGEVADLQPDLVVLALNLRLFDADVGHPRNDLSSALHWNELPRAAGLPLHARGLTLPRLMLFQLLDVPSVESAYTFSLGLQQRFHEAGWWNPLDQEFPDTGKLRRIRQVLSRYDVDIALEAPMTRMLEASVRMATERGIPTLVVVSPIPWEMLTEKHLYDRERQKQRIALLNRVVEAAGGTLIDAHHLLSRSGFRDHVGHFTNRGAKRLARRLEPQIRSRLPRPEGRGSARP